jgi:fatty acid desaturase
VFSGDDLADREPSGWDRKVWVSREELGELSRIPTLKVFGAITLIWAGLFATLQMALTLRSVPFYALAFVINGFLFLWLAYWEHEATHGLLTHDRRRNDLLADLFLAGPFGVTVEQHRWAHARHHAGVNDPEVEVDHTAWICIGGAQLFVQIVLHAIAWHGVGTILRYRGEARHPKKAELPGRTAASIVGLTVVNGAVLLVCILQGQWYAYPLLWALPFFTIAVAAMNLFNIVEHQASSDVCETGLVRMPPITRVVRAGFLERMLIAPVGSFYHLEHHQFPNVPAMRLPELRRILEERGRFEERDIVRTDGFLRTLWKLSRDRSFGERLASARYFTPSPPPIV